MKVDEKENKKSVEPDLHYHKKFERHQHGLHYGGHISHAHITPVQIVIEKKK